MLVVEVFSLQKVFKLIEVAVVGRHRGRGQVNTADEAKFGSPICSTFWLNIVWTLHDVQHWLNINFLTEALIVSCMVGCCHGEESNPFIAVGLVAHTIKNLPAMQETGFRSLRREHPQKENGYPLQYSCLGNPTDRWAWWAIVHGVAELDTTEQLTHFHWPMLAAGAVAFSASHCFAEHTSKM